MKRNEAGFTLVEMLIVLFIIGLIIAIAIPNLTKTGDAAQSHAEKANIKMLEAQAENYRLTEGAYPAKLDDLKEENYIKELPQCGNDKSFIIKNRDPFTVECEE